MKSRWASMLLCLAWSPPASADAAAPAPQLTLPSIVPSDGVLPLYGSCFDRGKCSLLRSIVVTEEKTDSAIAGHVEIVKEDGQEGWGYFVPDQPFKVGVVLVVKPSGGYPLIQSMVSVTKPSTLGADAVALTATLAKERTVLASTCCPNTNPNPGPTVKPRCLDTSVVYSAVLSATLSAVKPVASQYLYEVALFAQGAQADGPLADFAPLRTDARPASHRGIFEDADSYCYTVRAKPLVGGEPVMLLEKCVDNHLTDVGRTDRTPDEVAVWSTTCQVPTVAGDGGVPGRPDAGGDDEVNAGGDDDDGFIDHEETSRVSNRDAGCQLGGAPAMLGAWWALPALLFGRAKRKRGT